MVMIISLMVKNVLLPMLVLPKRLLSRRLPVKMTRERISFRPLLCQPILRVLQSRINMTKWVYAVQIPLKSFLITYGFQKEYLLGDPDKGFKQFVYTLDGGRISIAALGLGIAQASLDKALQYAKERKQFGRPISRFQSIQFKLADMSMEVELARNMVY